MQLDLTDEETAALAQQLRETIDADRYPLAAKLGLPGRHSDQVVHHATDPQVFAGGEQCRDALHVNRTGPLERTVLQRAGRSLRPHQCRRGMETSYPGASRRRGRALPILRLEAPLPRPRSFSRYQPPGTRSRANEP